MKTLSQWLIILSISLLLIACNSSGTDDTTATIDPYQAGNTMPETITDQEEYWANEIWICEGRHAASRAHRIPQI
jgi:hypothetical protein